MAFGKKKTVEGPKVDQGNVFELASAALARTRATRVRLAIEVTLVSPMLMHQWGQKAILQLIEKGVEASASKLAAVSRTEWEMRTTSLKAYASAEDFVELGQPSQYFFGAYCQAEGRMFLAYFTSRSAALLTQSFLAASRKGLQATPQMQEIAVAEISNVVLNSIAGTLADFCGMAFILTAPKVARGMRMDIIKAAFGDLQAASKIFSATINLSSRDIAADCTLMVMLDDRIIDFVLEALDR